MIMNILITGAAGFIGHHLSFRFCKEGHQVVGLDNLNEYYSRSLKKARLDRMSNFANFQFLHADICDELNIYAIIEKKEITHIAHMAAQAGVRYSLQNPLEYSRSNLLGFSVILEACRRYKVEHLLFASSSSVYGRCMTQPFSASLGADHPVSYYAATKRSNELCAHSYSSMYDLPATGLRFFTVYGPWGRPDMALFIFTRAILEGKPIPVFNMGQQYRDFTYINDVVDVTANLMFTPALPSSEWNAVVPDPACSSAPFRIYNVGAGNPTSLLEFIAILENVLKRKAQLEFLPRCPGDVDVTSADIEPLRKSIGFTPKTSLTKGITSFVAWYKNYYNVNSST
jgi:UDP-glucuronate 4-epimerase